MVAKVIKMSKYSKMLIKVAKSLCWFVMTGLRGFIQTALSWCLLSEARCQFSS